MYFHYESGYDGRELAAHIRQEKNVAKEMGLLERSHFLGLMQNLVCTFYEIGRVESVPQMSSEVIKMKMSNEANNILSYLSAPRGKKIKNKKNHEVVRRKVYKYPCSICKKEYNNIANHLKHAHRLSQKEIEELKRNNNKNNQEGAKDNQDRGKSNKRPMRCCPINGCTWVGRRYDYHLPKVHAIKIGSKKYLSLVKGALG